MNTSNPKYITYRGAKYERVNTLSEIMVVPSNQCCIFTISIVRANNLSDIVFNKEYKSGNPEGIADSTLKEWIKLEYANSKPDELQYAEENIEEFFSEEPTRVDEYSYYGEIGAQRFFIVCTKGKGKWSYLYDLAKQNDNQGIRDAMKNVADDIDDAAE